MDPAGFQPGHLGGPDIKGPGAAPKCAGAAPALAVGFEHLHRQSSLGEQGAGRQTSDASPHDRHVDALGQAGNRGRIHGRMLPPGQSRTLPVAGWGPAPSWSMTTTLLVAVLALLVLLVLWLVARAAALMLRLALLAALAVGLALVVGLRASGPPVVSPPSSPSGAPAAAPLPSPR